MKFEEWWDTYHNKCESPYHNCKDAWEKATCNTNLQVEQLKGELLSLANALYRNHYADLPDAVPFLPFDDCLGLITQIDNMTTGLVHESKAVVNSELTPDHIANVSKMIVKRVKAQGLRKAPYKTERYGEWYEHVFAIGADETFYVTFTDDAYKAMLEAAQEKE